MSSTDRLYQSDTTERVQITKRRVDSHIIVPSGDRRHMSGIRDGKISAEVWSKANLALIVLDDDLGRIDNGISDEGSTEGSGSDAQAVRSEGGGSDLLRKGKRTRKRKDNASEDEQRLQEGGKAQEGDKEVKRPRRKKPVTKEVQP